MKVKLDRLTTSHRKSNTVLMTAAYFKRITEDRIDSKLRPVAHTGCTWHTTRECWSRGINFSQRFVKMKLSPPSCQLHLTSVQQPYLSTTQPTLLNTYHEA